MTITTLVLKRNLNPPNFIDYTEAELLAYLEYLIDRTKTRIAFEERLGTK
jgi:hypothetical protein